MPLPDIKQEETLAWAESQTDWARNLINAAGERADGEDDVASIARSLLAISHLLHVQTVLTHVVPLGGEIPTWPGPH